MRTLLDAPHTRMHPEWGERVAIRILAVEDEACHQELLAEIFEGEEFQITLADCGPVALDWLNRERFHVVLLDNNMPGMSGIELVHHIRARPDCALLPLIMVTALNSHFDLDRSFRAGVDDFVGKPYSPIELVARVRAAAYRKWATDQLENADVVLFSLAHIVEARDSTTGRHCARLAHISQVFGQRLGLGPRELMALKRGSVLHDIGKLVIPDAILNKPGPLNDEERQAMSCHPVIGAELCQGLDTMAPALPVIRYHHERFDGRGYPEGLAGEAIPLLARLFQIVDIFDALSNKRPYKDALPMDTTLRILEEGGQTGVSDPAMMSVFLDLARREPEVLALPAAVDGRSEAIFNALHEVGALRHSRFTHCTQD